MRGVGGTSAPLARVGALILAAFLTAAPVAWAQPKPATPPPATNPAQSLIYTMEQLRTGPITPEILKQLGPLNTMGEIETLLKANRIAFAWQIVDVAVSALPPELASQIAALKPTDVFVVPTSQGALIGTILSKR